MGLFEYGEKKFLEKNAPLAWRLRPRTLEEFIGQEEILGPGKSLRRAIEADRLTAVILYGPPGTGKTSLAQVIAHHTAAYFLRVSAVATGVGELRKIIASARERLILEHRKTILFLDEVHRFNKAQQDVLLPALEQGILIFIGATTENPYFALNTALLSRAQVFRLEPLKEEELETLISRALWDTERGLGKHKVELLPAAQSYLVRMANGDARVALNTLERVALSTPSDKEGKKVIGLPEMQSMFTQKALRYDRQGDQHYDVVSAFIKSMRGSDPDATLHWLARMLVAGEDPRFIARRMVILAAEDVGLADPQALLMATAAAQAVEFVGMPEAKLALAEAAVYLACAPKSNCVYEGLAEAEKDVRGQKSGEVPFHLRDASYQGAKKLGHGEGYLYPHSFPGAYVSQQYLPSALQGKKYYLPSENGFEQKIKKRLQELQEKVFRG